MIATLTIVDRFIGTEIFAGEFRSLAAAKDALANELFEWTGTHIARRDDAGSDVTMRGFKAFDVVKVIEGYDVEVVAHAFIEN